VPSAKIATSGQRGRPSDAIHNALSVGHSSSRLPIGLSIRTSRRYRGKRASMAKHRVGNPGILEPSGGPRHVAVGGEPPQDAGRRRRAGSSGAAP
jgi:hypothetical protein